MSASVIRENQRGHFAERGEVIQERIPMAARFQRERDFDAAGKRMRKAASEFSAHWLHKRPSAA
jgi:hypothetical protein